MREKKLRAVALAVGLCIVLSAFCALANPVTASSSEPVFDVVRLTNNNLGDGGPVTDGKFVAWLQWAEPGSSTEIMVYNIQSEEYSQLTDNEYSEGHLLIDNGLVVGHFEDGNDQEICLYDLNTMSLVFQTENEFDDRSAKIHNGQIVWYGFPDDPDFGEIYFYDTAVGNSEPVRLTEDGYDDINPDIHNGQIVWANDEGIFFYDLNTGFKDEISLYPFDYGDNPRVHEGLVTWGSTSHSPPIDREIFLYDSFEGVTFRVTENTYSDSAPIIENGKIVWYAVPDYPNPTEMFFYDYYSDNPSVTRLTHNTYRDEAHRMHNGQIVWLGSPYYSDVFFYDSIKDIGPIQLFDTGFLSEVPGGVDCIYDGYIAFTGASTWQGEIFLAKPVVTTIQATVDFDPNTLNLRCKGKWVTAYIELPAEYDVSDIDVTTVLVQGVITAAVSPTNVGDFDGDGVPDLMVKFDRAALQSLVSVGESVEVTISGTLADGTDFQGTDTIRVIDEGNEHVNEEDPSAVS